MSVRRRLAATAIAGAVGVGFSTIPAASALAKPAPAPARPAASAKQVKPQPSHAGALRPAPIPMKQIIADVVAALNQHPEAFTPLLTVSPQQLFGSFGYVTAVNPAQHTVTITEKLGVPRQHSQQLTVDAGPAIVLRNNTPATLSDVHVADRIGVAGSCQGSHYTALTMLVHGPA